MNSVGAGGVIGALVAAGIAGRIRVIGVDVCGLVRDAFFPIRAVIIRAFVPVARAVLAPVAVAVLMGGRRDGALVAAGVAGRIRVIGVDVCGLVRDAFFPIRAVNRRCIRANGSCRPCASRRSGAHGRAA